MHPEHHSFRKLVCSALITASLVAGVHSARGQDGVKLSLSDREAAPRRELPKIDKGTVFRRLIEGFNPGREPFDVAGTRGSKKLPTVTPSTWATITGAQSDSQNQSQFFGRSTASPASVGWLSAPKRPHDQFLVATASLGHPVGYVAHSAIAASQDTTALPPTAEDGLQTTPEFDQSALVEAEVSIFGGEGESEAILPEANGPRYQTPKGITPLTEQGQLFGALWGENDKEEVGSRFLTQKQTFPLGPTVRTFSNAEYGERLAAYSTYNWAAPALYHKPLYFEQVNLERYGQGPRHFLQPAFSASHFFINIAKLPYHVGATPPCENVYVLGHYRPGNCAPYQWHKPRASWRGLVYQGVASGGLGVLIAP